MKLMFQNLHLSRLKHVQDQQDKVCIPCHGEDSPSPAAAGRCTADDSWKIENLNIRTIETQDPRHNRESCERVCRHFRLCIRQPVQNSGLTNAGESDENHRCVTAFANLEGRSATLRGGTFQLLVQPCELGFEEANMVFGFLVDLGLLHLLLYLLNLLWKTQLALPLLPPNAIDRVL